MEALWDCVGSGKRGVFPVFFVESNALFSSPMRPVTGVVVFRSLFELSSCISQLALNSEID